MNTNLSSISKMPVPTWGWLSINETSLPVQDAPKVCNALQDPVLPAGVTLTVGDATYMQVERALVLKETADYVAENQNHTAHLHIGKDVQADAPIVLHYQMTDAENALVNQLSITAEEGSHACVVVRYDGTNKKPIFHAGSVVVEVKKGAQLQYIGVQMLGEHDIHADAVQAKVHGEGKFDVLMTELGAGQSAVAADVMLLETAAHTQLDCIYVGTKQNVKDYNYRIEFCDKETEGHIVAKGVLADEARKTMKSTIDFISGASDSKGHEEEAVLVLSDKVINRSTPLLLCGEDFVEAGHATSIGKPNAEKLYYLMCRGFSEKAARKLLVEASLMPLLDKVEDDALRESLTELVREVVRDAG